MNKETEEKIDAIYDRVRAQAATMKETDGAALNDLVREASDEIKAILIECGELKLV